jgi:hypothetical protein
LGKDGDELILRKLFFMKKLIIFLFALLLHFNYLNAQVSTEEKLKIFVEGDFRMDFNHMRNNTPFVNFVNDPKVSEVHIIMSRQRTGGGGYHFSIQYYGLEFPKMPEFKLSCYTLSFDTDEIVREKLVKTMHVGLLLYINEKNGLGGLFVKNKKNKGGANVGTVDSLEDYDPWNKWIFRVGALIDFSGQERKNRFNYKLYGRASKITDSWKINFEYDDQRYEGTVEKDSGEKIKSLNVYRDADIRLIFSIDPHWSYGVFMQAEQSTYRNLKTSFEAIPAIQYNVFDWDESDRKQFTFSYDVGPMFNNYYETTVLDKMSEWLWRESIEINLSKIETWGELEIWLEGGHFFPGFSNYYYETGIDLGFRVSKGFSVTFQLEAESIHNQIYLPGSQLTDQELLLNTRQLPTTFEYSGTIGFRFQFGSFYNNVVNERL